MVLCWCSCDTTKWCRNSTQLKNWKKIFVFIQRHLYISHFEICKNYKECENTKFIGKRRFDKFTFKILITASKDPLDIEEWLQGNPCNSCKLIFQILGWNINSRINRLISKPFQATNLSLVRFSVQPSPLEYIEKLRKICHLKILSNLKLSAEIFRMISDNDLILVFSRS